MGEESDLATGAGGPDDRPEVDPFDPVALEERLKDARVRRERAIAMRASNKPSVPQPQAKPPAPIEPARARASRGRGNLYVVAMFVAGAGLGATAASLSQAPQFQQARAFLAQTSGKSGDGGPAPSANVQEPPSLGMIGISELPAIDAGSSEATGPDLPEIRKVAGISKPEPTGSAGPAPEAWIPAGAAAPPRFTRSPALPVPRPGAGLAAGPPSRPEASRASVLPPVLFDTSVASPPLPGSSQVYLNVPVTVSEEIAAAALETLRAAGLGEVFLAKSRGPQRFERGSSNLSDTVTARQVDLRGSGQRWRSNGRIEKRAGTRTPRTLRAAMAGRPRDRRGTRHGKRGDLVKRGGARRSPRGIHTSGAGPANPVGSGLLMPATFRDLWQIGACRLRGAAHLAGGARKCRSMPSEGG